MGECEIRAIYRTLLKESIHIPEAVVIQQRRACVVRRGRDEVTKAGSWAVLVCLCEKVGMEHGWFDA